MQPIPPAFVNELKGKFPSTPVLKTECGGSWEVEIKEVGQKYCFVNGWLEFVNFHKLEEYDFLVFWLIDDSIFQVTIYDPTCCEKKLHPPLHTNICETKIDPFEKSNPSWDPLFFVVVLFVFLFLFLQLGLYELYCTFALIACIGSYTECLKKPRAYPSPKIEDPCFVSALNKTSKKNLVSTLRSMVLFPLN